MDVTVQRVDRKRMNGSFVELLRIAEWFLWAVGLC